MLCRSERLPTANCRVVLFVISFLQLFLAERVLADEREPRVEHGAEPTAMRVRLDGRRIQQCPVSVRSSAHTHSPLTVCVSV